MKALVAPTYGPLDKLEFAERPVPTPGTGQVLIRTHAAALNPLDIKIITGLVQEVFPVTHPFTPGLDVAGVVESVGPDVTGYAPGDDVAAFTVPLFGALAEYTLATAGPCLARRPGRLDVVQAAALPAAAMTAATMLDLAQPRPGQTVLIVGATGGVGSFAVQLATQAGARVLATARTEDADQIRALGARHAIDYSNQVTASQARAIAPGGVDIAIDLVSANLADTIPAIADGGRLVSLVGEERTGHNTRGITVVRSDMQPMPGRLGELLELADTGSLTVPVSTVYPFAEADRALADLAGKHTRGKLAVRF
ncbi:NADP-dependent oxidoreductase [Stackebrandtia nassauensis]|uniref:Alcohol dehydrogenase zinc-binding domain protein n=1 Tax=Stackebrandtia nassauensis (strain DSM 44728 / CIP 108903 / NRRL B-16338 / NBRC 102104 / LLR-40K-21) TaxID=446470 RepID=D3Q3F7_STANL|nr:NADP-dependent oxidoreductase [Stackebrandtia nassauensis]ADD41998.1 Alcohol dehydrogenase zinc-binding domain protein [Stackebrandtia nassauensis DSM 44728]